jgi:hypothetical protein
MMEDGKRMDLMFIPIKNGLLKIHIFGFHLMGAWGQVFAELNGTKVNAKGYHRKKTIVRCLAKLNRTLLN